MGLHAWQNWQAKIRKKRSVMAQYKFKTKLIPHREIDAAVIKPPFDVVETFQRKGRVPIKGTINGFPYRSSLMNMGEGHMLAVNAQMRAGARCRAGDVVDVVMELDDEKRTVELPAYLKKLISSNAKVEDAWAKLSFTYQKEYVRAIEGAKKPETREKRIAAMMSFLRQGAGKRAKKP
jgi:hypothetical protein